MTLSIQQFNESPEADNIHPYSNPHIPGQRLKVQVPREKGPGDSFAVSIPAPEVTDETDGNKFTREFQELAAEYATIFDSFCHLEGMLVVV